MCDCVHYWPQILQAQHHLCIFLLKCPIVQRAVWHGRFLTPGALGGSA